MLLRLLTLARRLGVTFALRNREGCRHRRHRHRRHRHRRRRRRRHRALSNACASCEVRIREGLDDGSRGEREMQSSGNSSL